ncbi:MAG: polymer-forming cytoskeletal protein [Gemmatimonadota bacterium]|jgi:cytoskeletal protein CcmA (bactofilin family)|nr:polymer-forming cytoskeletal protein [Gemmatimonadota bacterium]
MAMFKKGDESRTRGGSTRLVSGEGAISIVGPGMRIVGDVVTDGSVRVEGQIEGTLRAGKGVVIGKGGEVIGDIFTHDAVVGGRVQGTVTAESRLELQSTCEIDGEIHTRAQHLQLDEGARFNGQIRMLDDPQPLKALPPETPAP